MVSQGAYSPGSGHRGWGVDAEEAGRISGRCQFSGCLLWEPAAKLSGQRVNAFLGPAEPCANWAARKLARPLSTWRGTGQGELTHTAPQSRGEASETSESSQALKQEVPRLPAVPSRALSRT